MEAITALLYVWLAALQAFDAWLTRRVLAEGGREPNLVMRWVMAKVGALPGLLLPKALVMGALLYTQPQAWVIGLLVAGYMGVCLHNMWDAGG